ncbi:MAG: hypothetical protein NTY38_03985 [Acidobacteria bacterium]|nr:hypothetical protein [Acidobacteriota bacterium]
MATESLVDVVRSLTPAEQQAVQEFVEFLKNRNSSVPSPFLRAVDEFVEHHSDLLTRLAQ